MNLDLGSIVLAQESQHVPQRKRCHVPDDFGVLDAGQFLRLVHGVVEITDPIDETGFFGLFARQNPSIRKAVLEFVDIHLPLLGDNADEFVIHFHDQVLHHVRFAFGRFTSGVEDVLVLARLECVGLDAHLVHQPGKGVTLQNDADASGDRQVHRHYIVRAHRGVIRSRSADGFHAGHHLFLPARLGHGPVNLIRSHHFTAGRIDSQDDGFDPFVFHRLVQLVFDGGNNALVARHAVGSANDAGEVNDRNFVPRTGIALDVFFFVLCAAGVGYDIRTPTAKGKGEQNETTHQAQEKEKRGDYGIDDPSRALGLRSKIGRCLVHDR